ncbi:hypothetical protein VHEMI04729 [[Torrubiella] hemipterigena]|uniref:Xylanolytic transcriptional activator regulatory domain-containing protein n=1 Tax=[Torrubiella] hemipterigena TaxID=1531966 RepID=A0A0A1TGZ5_9HYPO|nr:hypothetical protein VHEMI04729 [[Torrubiella] hemipterigena]
MDESTAVLRGPRINTCLHLEWPHAKTAVGAMNTGSGRMDRPDIHQHQQTRPLVPMQNTYGMDTRIQHSPEGLQTTAAIVKSSEISSKPVGNQPPPSWQESPEISSTTGSSFSTPSDIVALVQKPQSRSSSTDWEVRRNSVLFRSPTAIPAYTSNSQSVRPGATAINTYATSSTTLDQSLRDVFQERSASITSSLRTPMFGGAGLPITATSSGMLLAAPPPVSPALSVFSGLTLPVPAVHNAGFAFMEPLSTTLKQSLRESIPIYIDVYWDKVNAMYPIIHRPSFKEAKLVDNEPVSTLHCAMAAVATQFLSHEDHRINGNQLHMYTSQKLREAFGMTLSHSTHPRPEEFTAFNEQTWPMDLLQATILFEYYSRFRGRDKDAYKPSALFQLVYYKLTHDQAVLETDFQSSMTWDQWIDMESRRRLISACFLLDVHSMRYFEQQQSCPIAFQYTQPETMPVYLFTRSKAAWEASSIKKWRSMHTASHHAQIVGEVLSQSPATIREYQSCPFDASILLSAHVLQLPPRASATRLDLIADASTVDIDSFTMADIFSDSAVAFTYLALHFAPLHVVLSVSGDSWVFNRKVLRAASFAQHQKQLATWRDSGSANVAVAFAARALRIFLGIYLDDKSVAKSQTSSILGRDISDFWGIYVCSLICWAFGHAGRDCAASGGPSRSAALHWLHAASGTQPGQIARLSGRRNAQGAVGLARELLERDCLGGRSILLADAVGVLRKLEDGDTCKRF